MAWNSVPYGRTCDNKSCISILCSGRTVGARGTTRRGWTKIMQPVDHLFHSPALYGLITSHNLHFSRVSYTHWWDHKTSPTAVPKASELAPCSLRPHWNSMRFFATVSLYDFNSMDEVKFATLYTAKFKHVTVILTCMLLCCDGITYVPALWNFQKADLEPYPYGKKYTTVSFPIHGALASNICLRDAPTYSCIQLSR